MLESKSGLHVPTDVDTHDSSFNLFGMKAKKGQDRVTSWTKERDAKTGAVSDVLDHFARYASFEQSVMEHADFLKDGSPTFRHKNPGYDAMLSSRDPVVWATGLENRSMGSVSIDTVPSGEMGISLPPIAALSSWPHGCALD